MFRQINELQRKLSLDALIAYQEKLAIYASILTQDQDKKESEKNLQSASPKAKRAKNMNLGTKLG